MNIPLDKTHAHAPITIKDCSKTYLQSFLTFDRSCLMYVAVLAERGNTNPEGLLDGRLMTALDPAEFNMSCTRHTDIYGDTDRVPPCRRADQKKE